MKASRDEAECGAGGGLDSYSRRGSHAAALQAG